MHPLGSPSCGDPSVSHTRLENLENRVQGVPTKPIPPGTPAGGHLHLHLHLGRNVNPPEPSSLRVGLGLEVRVRVRGFK